jgi:hypothetical protein
LSDTVTEAASAADVMTAEQIAATTTAFMVRSPLRSRW